MAPKDGCLLQAALSTDPTLSGIETPYLVRIVRPGSTVYNVLKFVRKPYGASFGWQLLRAVYAEVPIFNIRDSISLIYTLCVEPLQDNLHAGLHLFQFTMHRPNPVETLVYR